MYNVMHEHITLYTTIFKFSYILFNSIVFQQVKITLSTNCCTMLSRVLNTKGSY